jgi:hypothetical protein
MTHIPVAALKQIVRVENDEEKKTKRNKRREKRLKRCKTRSIKIKVERQEKMLIRKKYVNKN